MSQGDPEVSFAHAAWRQCFIDHIGRTSELVTHRPGSPDPLRASCSRLPMCQGATVSSGTRSHVHHISMARWLLGHCRSWYHSVLAIAGPMGTMPQWFIGPTSHGATIGSSISVSRVPSCCWRLGVLVSSHLGTCGSSLAMIAWNQGMDPSGSTGFS